MTLKYLTNIINSNFKLAMWYDVPYPKELRKQTYWIDHIAESASNCGSILLRLKRPLFASTFIIWVSTIVAMFLKSDSTFFSFLFFIASLLFAVAIHIDSWEMHTSRLICDYAAHIESSNAFKTMKDKLWQGQDFKNTILNWVAIEREYIQLWRKEPIELQEFKYEVTQQVKDMLTSKFNVYKPLIFEVSSKRLVILDVKEIKGLPNKLNNIELDFRLRYDVDLKKMKTS